MGLRAAFNNSQTGLRVAQTGLGVVAHNLANADTDGYSRQRAHMEAYDPARVGSSRHAGLGARVRLVARVHAQHLERQENRDRTLRGFHEGRTHVLASMERMFSPDSGPMIGDRLDGFFNAARELSQHPDSFGMRATFVETARNVAESFNLTARDLRQVQEGIDDDLRAKATRINELSALIGEMNARIVVTQADGSMANDFLDRRDQAVRELSELTDLRTHPQKDGTLTVETSRGYALVVGDQSATLEAVPNAANNGLLSLELVGFTGQRLDITAQLNRGEVGGLLDARDRIVAGQIDNLDQLAFEFANAVNAAHQAGFGMDGVGGRDLFTAPAGQAFAAANLSLDAAIDADPNRVAAATDAALVSGDNRNAMALADLQDADLANIGTNANERFADMLAIIGKEVSVNAERAEIHDVRVNQSEGLRESVEGVSVDDEMLDLTRFQKHFEASSRVINTVNQLLDSLMNLLR